MVQFKSSLLSLLSAYAFLPNSVVEGHGYLKTPRSRNWVAQEDGVNAGGPANDGKPEQDFCPHCLNSKAANNLCSKGNAATLYDNWLDINGNPMPWTSQGVYTEGDEITVESVLTTNHAGHMDMYLCPMGNDSTQECLWANPATLVRDNLYGGPTDPDYPERAYFANDQSQFSFTYKLPEGLYGEKVLVQWRYITANSCFPPGYKNTPVGQRLQELGWLRASGMSDCIVPYDPTGATGSGKPEQFWNCAEITINQKAPTAPTVAPPPSPPTTQAPVKTPTPPPVAEPGPGYCSYAHFDPNRDMCDGLVEGGPWCNESQGQCEGSCNGTWCNIVVPTTSEPTSSPSSRPTTSPTVLPTSCTDIPTDKFFFKFNYNKDPPKPVYKDCNFLMTKTEQRRAAICRDHIDSYGGYGPPAEVCKAACNQCPTVGPTMGPTKSPTKAPTPVTSQPTKTPTVTTSSPTKAPVGEVCCSQFFNVCKDNPWCQESEENCTVCNGVFLPNLPLQCIPRFGMCTDNEDGCCFPSTCVKDGTTGAGQCMYYP